MSYGSTNSPELRNRLLPSTIASWAEHSAAMPANLDVRGADQELQPTRRKRPVDDLTRAPPGTPLPWLRGERALASVRLSGRARCR
eukprot:3163383-Pyramimonas_sp.AAC.1